MTSLLKHSNNNLIVIAFITVALLGFGCSKKEKAKKSIVKVNNSILTEENLQSALADNFNNKLYREEYIRRWIETEILYQQATENGIQNESEFKSLLEKDKKELAAAFFINQIISKANIEPSEDEIKKFFEANKDEFKLNDDGYLINEIQFSNFDKAVQFRNFVIENDWNKAVINFRADESITMNAGQRFIYKYQIQPMSILRVISNLEMNEISTVLEVQPKIYSVMQILKKYNKDFIPNYELVKNDVKERLLVINKKEYLKKYIDKLISDHNLDIERYTE